MRSSNIILTILGGGQEIGANSYLIEWGNYRIILDAGLNPKASGYGALPELDLLHGKEIDAAIVTHAHLDHIGALPFLVDQYFALGAKVFVTPPNRDLIPHMLNETVKAVERDRLPPEELYYFHHFFNPQGLETLRTRISAADYNQSFEIQDGLKGTFFPAGHVLGSAGIIITDGDYTLVYTGDIHRADQECISACKFPNDSAVDCLLIESTHGAQSDQPMVDRNREYLRFAEAIGKIIQQDGHVLVPCFGLGRTQEIIMMLNRMKQEGLIPPKTSVYFQQGVTQGINEIYDNYPSYLKETSAGKALASMCTPKSIYKDNNRTMPVGEISSEPAIFVFTSGMMNRNSASARLAEELIQSEEHAIFFTGYVAPGEIGYELLHSRAGGHVCFNLESQKWVPVKCRNIDKFSFSAHSGRQDLLKFAGDLQPDLTLWVHGDLAATEWLARNFQAEHDRHTLAPANRETILLRQGKRKVNRSLKETRAIIVTVGTSLITTCLRRSGIKANPEEVTRQDLESFIGQHLQDLPHLCVETNTIGRQKWCDSDILYLVCGDNEVGGLCGEVLAGLYEGHRICELVKVEGLRPEVESFAEKGMNNLIDSLVAIIERHSGNTVIHASGGFKGQVAIAAMLGILFRQEVFYIFEEFEDLVKLPELPLEFDYNVLDANRDSFFQLLDAREYRLADETYARLPDMLKSCFHFDAAQRKYSPTYLGRAVLSSFQNYIGRKAIEIPTRALNDSSLWGPERDSVSKILNPMIALILERVSRYREIITLFEFSSFETRQIGGKLPKENFLELAGSKSDQLKYLIHHASATPGKQDTITIRTVPGMGKYLLKALGRKIYP